MEETKFHSHSIVKLEDHLGSDQSIERAARVSYGIDTRKVSDTRGLLRYLMRHKHTSPFEMAEVVFYIKLPIFVMRQWIRHRTANVNEYSARYSIVKDEFYLPDIDYIQEQSTSNKQGREDKGELTYQDKFDIQHAMSLHFQTSKNFYDALLEDNVAKELARIVMPVAAYTECYWKCDLHNLMHLLKLRMDPHAQREIRDFANSMYEIVKPLFPLSFEAFDDYVLNAKTFSKMEMDMLKGLLKMVDHTNLMNYITTETTTDSKITERELNEFKQKLGIE